MNSKQREKQTKQITILGAIVNLVLAIIKIIAGILGNSNALFADGIHSLSDLISDFIVYWSANHSSKAPDSDHPYGHERFETLATLGLSIILALAGIYIISSAILQVGENNNLEYNTLLITIAIISVVSKEFLYQITMLVSKKINSPLLKANAWHHRLDAISSIIVFIGIIGSVFGYYYFDLMAAIIVGGMVLKIAWELSSDAIKELVDTAIDEKLVQELKTNIEKLDGIISVHSLRTRKIGTKITADIHIQVDPYLSVSEGHMLGICAEKIANNFLENLAEIVVHIDPEDDEDKNYNYDVLPNRIDTLKQIREILIKNSCNNNVKNIQLHYLEGRINIDFYLNVSCLNQESKENILKNMQQIFKDFKDFNKIRIYFE